MKAPQLFTIPAGACARRCRGATCPESVYDVKMPSGKVAPIVVNRQRHPDCEHPTANREGRGISHFITCPDVAQFRRAPQVRGAG